MRGFPALERSQSHRVRRWDALVLGGALPGLVASAALARRGRRVLLIEDSQAARSHAGLQEPFHLCAPDAEGILGAVLRGLGLPLIDQRRFRRSPEPMQVVTPDARIRLGGAAVAAAEIARWGLGREETTRMLLESLEAAGRLEREALLGSEILNAGRRRAFGRKLGADSLSERGLPASLGQASVTLQQLLHALVGALGNHGSAEASSEARARLLGSALEAPLALYGEEDGLRGVLRRRADALHVEHRRVEGPLRLVSVAGQPGLDSRSRQEVWTGRALILNAPRSALQEAFEDELPGFLRAEPARERRHLAHFRAPRERLPDGLGDRLVVLHPASETSGDRKWARVRVIPGAGGMSEIIASTDGPADVDREDLLEASVRNLLPFSDDWLDAQTVPKAGWDSDVWLPESKSGGGWPRIGKLRVASRPAVYSLERGSMAALGTEGDLLLGWRGGEAIAAELG